MSIFSLSSLPPLLPFSPVASVCELEVRPTYMQSLQLRIPVAWRLCIIAALENTYSIEFCSYNDVRNTTEACSCFRPRVEVPNPAVQLGLLSGYPWGGQQEASLGSRQLHVSRPPGSGLHSSKPLHK